ncbi:uncharacterized protein PFL1_05926 [Pseudozyma flocculosa PF-1]|uniref:J domain-containing protein n=1 Tax=Pseudozyma flocculosa PF-1 TaxID=1277687 RepID=A0A061H3W7_9BASI|nr:uncharacterized protein PFL1_05926 [Pseudozyma flocculosa PF-1]EPQ26605.1 hypothetical protein PFL1_05926 [Pseudozyma flocculosa PF-1]
MLRSARLITSRQHPVATNRASHHTVAAASSAAALCTTRRQPLPSSSKLHGPLCPSSTRHAPPRHVPTTTTALRRLATSAPDSASAAPVEANALQVTDPLLIYRAKVARGELEEDEEQLRALVELRRINRTLRDYIPPAHLLGILNQDTHAQEAQAARTIQQQRRLAEQRSQDDQDPSPVPQKEKIGDLVRWLSDTEGLAELGTPKGLMITGTPGTGKSMVMDIFYDSLPTKHKFRRHYHHLLLDLYKIIWDEAERRRIALRQGGPRKTVAPRRGLGGVWVREGKGKGKAAPASDASPDNQRGWKRLLEGMPFMRYDSLEDKPADAPDIPGPDGDVVKTTLPLHAAAHLFLKHGHILLFDEIQLVDVASAGLLRRTLEAYWRLGGVVIGTSNRIPKDLYASNVQRGQLTQFLEILGERCPNFEMRKTRDFRREPFYREEWLKRRQQAEGEGEEGQDAAGEAAGREATGPESAAPPRRATYFVRGEEDEFRAAAQDAIRGREGIPASVEVYGRKLLIPFSISASDAGPSVCRFTFEQLCDSPLGPADYLTLASTYHTFIIDAVPQLTLMQKNQARRLITLLDAVYEAGCRLILLADSSPDDLFFPDAKDAARHAAKGAAAGPGTIVEEIRGGQYVTSSAGEHDDVVDMSANGGINPFKTPPAGQAYPEEHELAEAQRRQRSSQQRVDVERDEFMSDSLIQMETLSEALQDTEEGFRPNILPYESRPDRSAGAREAMREEERGKQRPEDELALQRERELSDKVGFKHLALFSGEDERFAYQRAVSRLFEMSHPDWVVRKSWRPFLNGEMDSWKGSEAEKRERMRELGQVPAVDAAAASSAGAPTPLLDEARAQLDGAKATVRPLRHTPAGLEAEGDFADEASYQESTFPARNADPSYWTEEHRRYYDQPNRGASNAGLPEDGRPNFDPGPVGRRDREGLPVLSDVHFWGVREDWGKKAGPWGRGAAVFEKEAAGGEGAGKGEGEGEGKGQGLDSELPRPSGAASSGGPGSAASTTATTGATSTPFHPTGRRSMSTSATHAGGSSSSSSSMRSVPRRGFSTTRRAAAQVVPDHYKTLQIQRTASKAQIKAQFYKLSKELHPDVNPSDDAKKKFQQVSEAYATLGSETARRVYDRDTSASSMQYGGGGGAATPGYSYDPTSNASRRARATYAWNHTRRSHPSSSSSSSSSQQRSESAGRQTHSSIFTHTKSHFETLAARQRRREELNNHRARSGVGGAGGRAARQHYDETRTLQEESSSAVVRFLQVGFMLYVVFKLGTMFVGSSAVGAQADDEWEDVEDVEVEVEVECVVRAMRGSHRGNEDGLQASRTL